MSGRGYSDDPDSNPKLLREERDELIKRCERLEWDLKVKDAELHGLSKDYAKQVVRTVTAQRLLLANEILSKAAELVSGEKFIGETAAARAAARAEVVADILRTYVYNDKP
jgi:hypothetical protein